MNFVEVKNDGKISRQMRRGQNVNILVKSRIVVLIENHIQILFSEQWAEYYFNLFIIFFYVISCFSYWFFFSILFGFFYNIIHCTIGTQASGLIDLFGNPARHKNLPFLIYYEFEFHITCYKEINWTNKMIDCLNPIFCLRITILLCSFFKTGSNSWRYYLEISGITSLNLKFIFLLNLFYI